LSQFRVFDAVTISMPIYMHGNQSMLVNQLHHLCHFAIVYHGQWDRKERTW